MLKVLMRKTRTVNLFFLASLSAFALGLALTVNALASSQCVVGFSTLDQIWSTKLSSASESEKKQVIQNALAADLCLRHRFDLGTRSGEYALQMIVTRVASPRNIYAEIEDLIEDETTEPIPEISLAAAKTSDARE